MNNFKKIGVSALAGSLIAFSANALDMSVSGGASLTFGDYGGDVTNNAWSSGDGLTFSATGETDGGLTITSSIVLDNGTNDDQSISIASDGMGTITFHALDGGSALSSVDDVMPTAYEEPWFGVTTPTKIDGKAYAGLFQYTSPTVAGATLTATYNQADTTNSDESLTSYAIAYSPEMVEGLSVGYAVQDDDSGAATTHVSEDTMYVKYVYGPVTVGYQKSEADNATAASSVDSTGMAISYAISDSLSVSYGEHTAETPNDATDTDQEATAISASYTSGGMTISATAGSVDNIGNTATNDADTYEISMSFAF
jgi:outer membrane protein OmpU